MSPRTRSIAAASLAAAAGSSLLSWLLCTGSAIAQTFTGDGQGEDQAANIATGGTSSLRETLQRLLTDVIRYMGLAAVVVIVIAGVILVVGIGSEESRERAQKIVLYTVVGLIVIVLASAIVQYVAELNT